MLVQLSQTVRIIPPSKVTGARWVAEDLLQKQRFTVIREVAAALVAAAQPQEPAELASAMARAPSSGTVETWERRIQDLIRRNLIVEPKAAADNPDYRWMTELIAAWEQAHWREAAEYHVLSFDYPCVDYSEVTAYGLDMARMREYQSAEPDDNRYKLDYVGRAGIELPEPAGAITTASAKVLWTDEWPWRRIDADSVKAIVSLTFGVTNERTPITAAAPLLRRTSPSGGGRHPTEGYLLVRTVPDIPPGWYHITLRPFSLRLIRSDSLDDATVHSLFPDTRAEPAGPAAVIMITSVFERNMYRYREPRTFRTVHMDAGHIAGTADLVARALGFNASAGDNCDSNAVEALLGLDGMVEGYMAHVTLYDGAPAHRDKPAATVAHAPQFDPTSGAADGLTDARPSPDAAPVDVTRDGVGWPAGCRIRPSNRFSGEIEVADIITGRAVRFAPAELAEAIQSGDAPPAAVRASATAAEQSRRAALLPGLCHWQQRGWHPSDQVYVASRRIGSASAIPQEVATAAARRLADPDDFEGPTVDLPEPAPPADIEIARLLLGRRTGRAYLRRPIPAGTLSGLLWYGLDRARGGAPSGAPGHGWVAAGGWEVCVCIYNVDGIDPGTYLYRPESHDLALVRKGDLRTEMVAVLQGMRSPNSAGWTLGLVADFARCQQICPRDGGLRSLYIQSGAIAQKILVLGSSYSLSTLVTPAQRDSPYLALHGLSRDRYSPIYTLTMGLYRGPDGVYPEDSEDANVEGAAFDPTRGLDL